MALSPAALASGFGGITANSQYPGPLSGFTQQGIPGYGISHTFTCPCGSPATKLFYNPRGESVSINSGSLCLFLCDACDFRWTVMRAAGRVEEFVTDYEEKVAVRARAEAESAEKMQVSQSEYYKQLQAQAQQQFQGNTQNWQGMQNAYKPSSGQSVCTENVRKQEEKQKAWYEQYGEYVRGVLGKK